MQGKNWLYEKIASFLNSRQLIESYENTVKEICYLLMKLSEQLCDKNNHWNLKFFLNTNNLFSCKDGFSVIFGADILDPNRKKKGFEYLYLLFPENTTLSHFHLRMVKHLRVLDSKFEGLQVSSDEIDIDLALYEELVREIVALCNMYVILTLLAETSLKKVDSSIEPSRPLWLVMSFSKIFSTTQLTSDQKEELIRKLKIAFHETALNLAYEAIDFWRKARENPEARHLVWDPEIEKEKVKEKAEK